MLVTITMYSDAHSMSYTTDTFYGICVAGIPLSLALAAMKRS